MGGLELQGKVCNHPELFEPRCAATWLMVGLGCQGMPGTQDVPRMMR